MIGQKIRGNHSHVSINQFVATTSIIVVLFLTILGILIIRHYLVNQAEARIQDVILEAEALHHYVQQEMHPTMYQLKMEGRMPENFYSPEILSSSYITRHVFHQYNTVRSTHNLPQVEYRMASKNPRNMVNMADSLESSLIELFNADTNLTKYTGILKENGTKYLYYAKPFLRINQNCLKCHGERNEAPVDLSKYYHWESGFNLKVGEIPAIEIIKTPIVAELRTSTNIGLGMLLIALILIGMIIMFARLTLTNDIIRRQKDEIATTLNKLKVTQAQLLQSEKMASLGTLTAGVAHEINNPLNFIKGAMAGFETFFNTKAPEYKNDVQVLLRGLKTGLERSTEIVQGLNQFSRTNGGLTEYCNLHTIIDNCLTILRNQYKNNIIIEKHYHEANLVVNGNSGKLHQVFINILQNSIHAIEKEGKITITTLRAADRAEIQIQDSGCGIKPDEIPKVFDPFFTTKEPGKGTGLGLSITYTIIQEHKGDIQIESKEKTGTLVKIYIPVTNKA